MSSLLLFDTFRYFEYRKSVRYCGGAYYEGSSAALSVLLIILWFIAFVVQSVDFTPGKVVIYVNKWYINGMLTNTCKFMLIDYYLNNNFTPLL